jgi:DnaJ-class molecular chaperone
VVMKNYYAILGVSQNETPAGIRAAYRNAVRRTHPDHAGPQGASAFQDIVEAHSVLSDPTRRREYDRSFGSYQQARMHHDIPVHRNRPRHPTFTDVHVEYPPIETLRQQPLHDFSDWSFSNPQQRQGLAVEVMLTPEEAARGGFLLLRIPIRSVCWACGGTGSDWLFPCLDCEGEGIMSTVEPVQIRIPRSLSVRAVPEVCYEMLASTNLVLRLRLRVSE